MRKTLVVLTMLSAGFLAAPLARAQEVPTVAEQPRDAVRSLLDDDGHARETARRALRNAGDRSVEELLRVVEELRVALARQPRSEAIVEFVDVTDKAEVADQGTRVAPPSDGEQRVQLYDVRDLLAQGRSAEALLDALHAASGEKFITVTSADNGVLIVRGAPDVHNAVRAQLESLRTLGSTMFMLEAKLVNIPRDMPFPVALANVRPGDLLLSGEAAIRAVDDALASAAAVLLAPTIVTLGGQRADVTIGRQISFVGDYGLETDSRGNWIADPQIETLFVGTQFEFRVLPAPKDGQLHLDVQIAHSTVREPFPVWPRKIPGSAVPVEVQVPETTDSKTRRALTIADGGISLLSVSGGPDGYGIALVTVTRLADEDFDVEEREADERDDINLDEPK